MPKPKTTLSTIHKITLILLLILNSIFFTFALLSGAEAYGGGFDGILTNIPSTLPWLAVFALIYLSWKKPLIGGLALIFTAITITFLFGLYESQAIWLLFFIPFPLTVAGIIFIACRNSNREY